MSGTKYYIQDSRSYVGNCMIWWRKGGKGYTTNLDEAEIYSTEKAMEMHHNRGTDRMWPVEYIKTKIQKHVDMQYCDRDEI